MRKPHPDEDWRDAAVVGIAVVVAAIVGGLVLAEVSNVPEERDAMRDRASVVYDDTAMTYHTQGDVMMDLPGPADPDAYTTTELVEKHLYVTGYSYPPDRLARVLDRGTGDVRESLRELEREGVLNSGWTHTYLWPEREWIHTAHGDLPNSVWRSTPLLEAALVVLAAVAITAVFGYRNRGDPDA